MFWNEILILWATEYLKSSKFGVLGENVVIYSLYKGLYKNSLHCFLSAKLKLSLIQNTDSNAEIRLLDLIAP